MTLFYILVPKFQMPKMCVEIKDHLNEHIHVKSTTCDQKGCSFELVCYAGLSSIICIHPVLHVLAARQIGFCICLMRAVSCGVPPAKRQNEVLLCTIVETKDGQGCTYPFLYGSRILKKRISGFSMKNSVEKADIWSRISRISYNQICENLEMSGYTKFKVLLGLASTINPIPKFSCDETGYTNVDTGEKVTEGRLPLKCYDRSGIQIFN